LPTTGSTWRATTDHTDDVESVAIAESLVDDGARAVRALLERAFIQEFPDDDWRGVAG